MIILLRRKNDIVSAFFFLFFFSVLICGGGCHGRIFSFQMHHRFSDPVKRWSSATADLPEKGSFEYYAHLADRDRLLRGRKLSEVGNSPLAFSDGNSTVRITSLGLCVFFALFLDSIFRVLE